MYRPVSIIISNGMFSFAILSYNMSKEMFHNQCHTAGGWYRNCPFSY